jgi:hypothetical protein
MYPCWITVNEACGVSFVEPGATVKDVFAVIHVLWGEVNLWDTPVFLLRVYLSEKYDCACLKSFEIAIHFFFACFPMVAVVIEDASLNHDVCPF